MIDSLNLDSQLIKLAAQLFGKDRAFNHTQEECAELIVAINHYRRGRIGPDKVAEEIADVYIMCQRIAEIIGVHLVDQKVIEKSKITRDRIKKELDKRDVQPTDSNIIHGPLSGNF